MGEYVPGGTPSEDDSGTDQTCAHELNKQLKTLAGRVKQLEKHAASLQEVQLEHIKQSAMGFLALIAEGMVTGLPAFIANAVILKIVAALLNQSESALEGLGSSPSFPFSIPNGLDAIEDQLASLLDGLINGTQIPALTWEMIMFQFMQALLNLEQYGEALVTGLLAQAEAAVVAARDALALDPLNTELQQAYLAALNIRDSTNSIAEGQNRMKDCITSTSRLLTGS